MDDNTAKIILELIAVIREQMVVPQSFMSGELHRQSDLRNAEAFVQITNQGRA